jgi:hypothetical protein
MSQSVYAAAIRGWIGGIIDSANGFRAMTEGDFFWMPSRQVTVDDLPTLRQVRDPVIELDCRLCRRRGNHERKRLIKAFGAGVTLVELRRRMTVGCERMHTAEGDRCDAYFPCLMERISSPDKG